MDQTDSATTGSPASDDLTLERRALAAPLPLQIYCLDEKGRECKAGITAGSRTVEVGKSVSCLVEPLRKMMEEDWDTVLALMKEQGIEGLRIEGQVTDSVMARLSRLDSLRFLALPRSTGVTDAGLRSLSRLPRLRHLDLSRCSEITDTGLEILRQLPDLRVFRMQQQNRITDTGLAPLAGSPHLEYVDLFGTETGDDAVCLLAGHKSLNRFRSGRRVTDNGLECLREWPAFRKWSGGPPSINLMSFDAESGYLLLRGSFTDEGLGHLANLDGLFALNVDDRNLAITTGGLRHLAKLPHLGWLAFDADDDSMPEIASFPRLRFLMCQDTTAGEEGFEALSRSRSLEYLWGRRCHNLTGKGFAALSKMPALRGLSVSCKNVDSAGLSPLPDFPSLRIFMPMDVSNDGFQFVGGCHSLEELICMYCENTTDAATGFLADLTQLKGYQAWSSRITDRSLDVLCRLPSLERVSLYNCGGITDSGMASLAKAPRLQEVTLADMPQVSADGMAQLPESVAIHLCM